MGRLGRFLGLSKKRPEATEDDTYSIQQSANVCEFWSQGKTDATTLSVYGQEGESKPTSLLVELTPPQSIDSDIQPALGAYCLLIDVSFSMNAEAQIKTDEGDDFQTNNGYILGTPFINAFMMMFDYDRNTVAFANKVNHFGAEILG